VDDDTDDLGVLVTHLDYAEGDSQLREARRMCDGTGPFPGRPGRALLLMDANCPDPMDPEQDWSQVPRNTHARYRQVNPDGTFGPSDRRALRVLMGSGWTNPQGLIQPPRAATVGYYYANEPQLLHLDHILYQGMTATAYRTLDTPRNRTLSDHLPSVLDVAW